MMKTRAMKENSYDKFIVFIKNNLLFRVPNRANDALKTNYSCF